MAFGTLRKILRRTYRRIKLAYYGKFGTIPLSEKWLFVVGCYNSGTTLLHDMLALHPEIGSMPTERHFLTDQLLSPGSVGLPRLWAINPEMFYLNENSKKVKDINRLKRQWGAYFNDLTRPILLEKSAPNASRIRWLQKHFKNSHFIGIIRNGYAVAEGISRRAGHSLDLAAKQWSKSNEITLRDFEYIDKKLLICYEELTEKPDIILQKIFEFLELSPINLDAGRKVWKIQEKVSKIKNMNQRSLDALSEEDLKIIESNAGSMLVRLGYKIG